MKILNWIVSAALLVTASGCAATPAAQPQQPRKLDSSLLRFYEPAPAWTDPERVRQWYPPGDYYVPEIELDARPGGAELGADADPFMLLRVAQVAGDHG